MNDLIAGTAERSQITSQIQHAVGAAYQLGGLSSDSTPGGLGKRPLHPTRPSRAMVASIEGFSEPPWPPLDNGRARR